MKKHGSRHGGNTRKIALLFCCLCIVFCLIPSTARAEQSGQVLLLCSYHQGDLWTDKIVEGVQSVFSGSEVDLHIEYLDARRHKDVNWLQAFKSGLAHKYQKHPPQVIICADDAALNFLLKHRDDLFTNIPIVFCGINNFHPRRIAGHRNITGVNESLDIVETIEMALRLQPEAKHLVAITSDRRPHWRANAAAFRELIPAFSERIHIRELKNLTLTDAPKALGAISPDSMVLALTLQLEDEMKHLDIEETYRFLSEHCGAPVYALWSTGIGNGILGGKMVSGFHQGEAAARIALRILAGESTANIPVLLESPNMPMVDWKIMKRFGIKEEDLPPGSQVLFKVPSLYEEYRIWFWIIPGLIILEALLIAGLLMNRFRRIRTERSLRESEERWQFALEGSRDGVWDWNAVTNEVFFSRRWKEMLGYNEDDISNHLDEWDKRVHPEDKEQCYIDLNKHFNGETPYYENEHRVLCKDGSYKWILDRGKVISWKEANTPQRVIGTHTDITERKQAEEALRQSEEKYRSILENIEDGYYETDIAGNFTFFNDSLCRIFGYPADELMGINYRKNTDQESADRIYQVFNKIYMTGKPIKGLQYVILKKDGSKVYVEVSASLVKNSEGRRIGFRGITRDITERKVAEEKRIALEDKLHRSQKMESLGLMAGGVAHDLNNILSGIVSYPELLLMDLPKDSPLRKPIETIKESGMKAADVVADLLTIARGVATGKDVLNLNTIVTEYFGSAEYQRLEKMHSFVDFKTEADPDLLNMSGSPSHIKKTLMNLVLNASEAIEGSGTVTISTTNRYLDEPLKGYEDVRIGEYAVLTVSDDGSGISEEDLERIFEPFYTKKVMERSGTGLGLAVVWNTVQDHKGYINVKSTEKGTVFELYFPVTREEVAGDKEKVPLEDYLGHGEKILVVDDEDRQREIASGILTRLGYITETVSSGEEAIEYVKGNLVDLIVLDMVMPKGINGRKTYEEIIKIRPAQKAIIASGFAKTKEVDLAQELGAGKYIKKPYTLEKVGLAVKEELEK